MCRPAAWHMKNRPLRLTSSTSSQSSSVTSRASWFVPTPALFTRTSIRPYRSTGGGHRRLSARQVEDVDRPRAGPPATADDVGGKRGDLVRCPRPCAHV